VVSLFCKNVARFIPHQHCDSEIQIAVPHVFGSGSMHIPPYYAVFTRVPKSLTMVTILDCFVLWVIPTWPDTFLPSLYCLLCLHKPLQSEQASFEWEAYKIKTLVRLKS
jgi:hypothetical protein